MRRRYTGCALGTGVQAGARPIFLFLLARERQAVEVVAVDDDMTSRAGHLALARPLKRHQMRLCDVEQDRTRLGFGFGSLFAVGVDEGDAPQVTPFQRAASLKALRPSRNSRRSDERRVGKEG